MSHTDGVGDTAAGLRAAVTPRNDPTKSSVKASQVIAKQLAKYIADNDLPDGARLPREGELAEIFGVGRTTLREGLRLLETRGVLTIRAGSTGGPFVRRPELATLSEAMTLILQLNGSPYSEVVVARRAIEPTIARLAAAQITDAELDDLQAIVDLTFAELDDHEIFAVETGRFHAVLARIARNAPLEAVLGALKNITDSRLSGTRHGKRHRDTAAIAHQRIVDVLRTRDPDQTEAIMRDHLDATWKYWTKAHATELAESIEWEQ